MLLMKSKRASFRITLWLFLILLPHGGAKSIVVMSLIVRLQSDNDEDSLSASFRNVLACSCLLQWNSKWTSVSSSAPQSHIGVSEIPVWCTPPPRDAHLRDSASNFAHCSRDRCFKWMSDKQYILAAVIVPRPVVDPVLVTGMTNYRIRPHRTTSNHIRPHRTTLDHIGLHLTKSDKTAQRRLQRPLTSCIPVLHIWR